jgi:hypothetical protein
MLSRKAMARSRSGLAFVVNSLRHAFVSRFKFSDPDTSFIVFSGYNISRYFKHVLMASFLQEWLFLV